MMSLHFIPFATPLLFIIPIFLIVAFAVLMIPSLHVEGSNPEQVAKAIGCVILKLIGTLLVTLSSVQMIESLLLQQLLPPQSFGILCITFGVGAVLMSAASHVVHGVNRASAIVPRSIALSLVITVASLCFVGAFLFVGVNIILTGSINEWQLPASILLVSTIVALVASLKLSALHSARPKSVKEKMVHVVEKVKAKAKTVRSRKKA